MTPLKSAFKTVKIKLIVVLKGLAKERAEPQREVGSLGRHSHQLQADLAAMYFTTATTPQLCPTSELSQALLNCILVQCLLTSAFLAAMYCTTCTRHQVSSALRYLTIH